MTFPLLTYSTAGIPDIAKELHTSEVIATLGVTTYVLGFAFGPLVWAPLSEARGRRPVYIFSWFIFTVFQIPCALAKNPGNRLLIAIDLSDADHRTTDRGYIWVLPSGQCRWDVSRDLDGRSCQR